jgi:hypothetical protein
MEWQNVRPAGDGGREKLRYSSKKKKAMPKFFRLTRNLKKSLKNNRNNKKSLKPIFPHYFFVNIPNTRDIV